MAGRSSAEVAEAEAALSGKRQAEAVLWGKVAGKKCDEGYSKVAGRSCVDTLGCDHLLDPSVLQPSCRAEALGGLARQQALHE